MTTEEESSYHRPWSLRQQVASSPSSVSVTSNPSEQSVSVIIPNEKKPSADSVILTRRGAGDDGQSPEIESVSEVAREAKLVVAVTAEDRRQSPVPVVSGGRARLVQVGQSQRHLEDGRLVLEGTLRSQIESIRRSVLRVVRVHLSVARFFPTLRAKFSVKPKGPKMGPNFEAFCQVFGTNF